MFAETFDLTPTLTAHSQIESKTQVADESLSSLQVHLVSCDDIFYIKGRILSKTVYKEVWSTENLVDKNDYGVVVATNKGEILGNVNLQLRKEKLLNSEVFFEKCHWKNYFEVPSENIAEISGFALDKNTPINLRKPVMMLAIVGLQNLCRLKKIQKLVTVQHDYLVRILTKSLKLPLLKNEIVNSLSFSIPNDDYWKRNKAPAIYYLEPFSSYVSETCYSYLSFLNLVLKIETTFNLRIQIESQTTYSSFYQDFYATPENLSKIYLNKDLISPGE